VRPALGRAGHGIPEDGEASLGAELNACEVMGMLLPPHRTTSVKGGAGRARPYPVYFYVLREASAATRTYPRDLEKLLETRWATIDPRRTLSARMRPPPRLAIRESPSRLASSSHTRHGCFDVSLATTGWKNMPGHDRPRMGDRPSAFASCAVMAMTASAGSGCTQRPPRSDANSKNIVLRNNRRIRRSISGETRHRH